MANKSKAVEALEITTFQLKGYSAQEFMDANHDIDKWLNKQPGFRSRHIAQEEDGTIVDVLVWDSVTNGTKAMHKIMDETADSLVHEMIDHGTVLWKCIPVYHHISVNNLKCKFNISI